MSDTRQKLAQAYELIGQEKVDEALEILKPLSEQEPENENVWWLMANAHSEHRAARRALVNVLKINPAHKDARKYLDILNEQYPPRDDELMMMMEIEDVQAELPQGETDNDGGFDDIIDDDFDIFDTGSSSSEIDDLFSEDSITNDNDDFALDDDEDPFAELLDDDSGKKGRRNKRSKDGGTSRRRLLIPLLLLMVLCLVGLMALLVFSGGSSDNTTEEDAQSFPTFTEVDAPTVNVEEGEQLEQIRLTAQSDSRALLGADASVLYGQQGDTFGLYIRVCTVNLRVQQVAVDGMQLLANRVGNTALIQDDIAHIGIVIVDCERPDDTLYQANAPIQPSIDFSQGAMLLPDFRAAWQVDG